MRTDLLPEFLAIARKCFALPPRMTPAEWAEEVYRLPNGGRFRFDYAPYVREMHASILDKRNIETVFQVFSRGLKSTVILLNMGYIIDLAPRRILSLWPTNSQAERFSKDILVGELFDTTEQLHYLGTRAAKRHGSNTILSKAFHGGLITMFGANAPGDMRRAKGNFLYADEIDAIDECETDEGDQLAIFVKRGDEYPDTARVFASYPSLKGHSRINAKLLESDYRQWHVICVECGGEPFVMHRRQLRYEPDAPSEARLECPHCKALLTDDDRVEMARNGEWVATLPFRGKRGFQANALLWPHPVDKDKYPGGFLQMLAQQEIDAEKSEDVNRSKRVLVNTVDAEVYDPEIKSEAPPDWAVLYQRREDYITKDGPIVIPKEGLVMVSGVDTQPDRLECHVGVYGRGEEYWAVSHTVIPGDIQRRETWEALEKELLREYGHALGGKMKLAFALIDAGHGADNLLWFLSHLRQTQSPLAGRIRACRGSSVYPHPIVDHRFSRLVRQLQGHWVGPDEAKDLLYSRLRMETPGPGYRHYGKNHGEQFFQQLTVERAITEFKAGKEIRKFVNPEKRRNEGLDVSVYELAAFRLRKWNFDAIEDELSISEQQKFAPKAEKREEPRQRAGVGGFVGVTSWQM